MSRIIISDSLIPSSANTPVDSRMIVSAVADIANIELPYVGMRVYCRANGKEYRILSLKSKQIGSLLVENAAVALYEEIKSVNDFTEEDFIFVLENGDSVTKTLLVKNSSANAQEEEE